MPTSSDSEIIIRNENYLSNEKMNQEFSLTDRKT